MNTSLQQSINRAIRLMGTPHDYENYVSIKIKLSKGGCCCFDCWPNTWSIINKYIFPFGPLEDEGDALIKQNNEGFVLECHESGPEIIIYSVISGLLVLSITKLVKAFLKALKEEKKHYWPLKIIIRRQTKEKQIKEDIVEINLPYSNKVIEKLDIILQNSIQKASKKPVYTRRIKKRKQKRG